MVEQLSAIAGDPGLQDEIARQATAGIELQTAELEVQRQQLTRQLARDHAELTRLVTSGQGGPAAGERIAELSRRRASVRVWNQ